MRISSLALALSISLAAGSIPAGWSKEAPRPSPTAAGYENPGPSEVAVRDLEWTDTKRNREVPVRIYFPREGKGPFPVIVFSHGLGGSREGYAYLGNHWASHGFVSVHLQHIGSDDSVWRGVALRDRMQALKGATGLKQFMDRPRDVSFAIDQLEKLNATEGDPLKGRLNLKKIGMAGHSFGAHTTLAIAGEVFPTRLLGEVSLGDPRVTAAIPMSPMPPKNPAMQEAAFSKIKIPTMHLTGTLDTSPIEVDRTAEERLIPYEKTPGTHHYLINFQGGDHMVFSGRIRGLRVQTGDPERDRIFRKLILQSTTAFWDAWLRDSEAARAWLTANEGGLKAALGEEAEYRWK